MNEGKPITAFLVTALVLWAVYLWKQGRLGKPGLLPHPSEIAPTSGKGKPPVLPWVGGWKPGQPPAEGTK